MYISMDDLKQKYNSKKIRRINEELSITKVKNLNQKIEEEYELC